MHGDAEKAGLAGGGWGKNVVQEDFRFQAEHLGRWLRPFTEKEERGGAGGGH